MSAANRGRGQPEGLPQAEARDAQRGGPPLESPCRWLSLVLSFASKESTSPFGAAAPPFAPESARHAPGRGSHTAKLTFLAACRRLSSGQTIGAARTAVRSAGCLPELRVISAFGGQPTGLTFLSVPPCTPSDHRKKCVASPACAVVGASVPLDRGTVPAQAHSGVSGGFPLTHRTPSGCRKKSVNAP